MKRERARGRQRQTREGFELELLENWWTQRAKFAGARREKGTLSSLLVGAPKRERIRELSYFIPRLWPRQDLQVSALVPLLLYP